ncbi:hypothetical protein WKK05_18685 [Nostoc sp. UHCC 0302]
MLLVENGDRLTRDKFERRYHVMPKHKSDRSAASSLVKCSKI